MNMDTWKWKAVSEAGAVAGPFTVPVRIEEEGGFLRVIDGWRDLSFRPRRNETGFVPDRGDKWIEVLVDKGSGWEHAEIAP